MAGENEEWTPKSREDWVGLFADGNKKAHADIRSETEEAAAKAAAEAAAGSTDKTGKDDKGGSGDNGGGPKRKSFAERLLGI